MLGQQMLRAAMHFSHGNYCLNYFPLFLFYQFEAPLFYFLGSTWFNIHAREAAAYGAIF